MIKFVRTKRPPILLLFLLATLPFLFGIAYMIGFNGKAHAAVGVDVSTSSNGAASWIHTIATQPNRLLLVGTSGNTTGVTYGGVALAPFDTFSNGGGKVTMWYLKESQLPPQATNIVTVTGGTSGGSISLYNVDQTNTFGPKGNTGGGNQNSNTGGGNLTYPMGGGYTTSGQLLVDTMNFITQNGTNPADLVPASRAVAWRSNVTNNNSNVASITTATSGTTFNSWTAKALNGTYGWANLMVGVNPAPIVPTTVPTAVPPTTAPTTAPTPIPPTSGNITNLNFGISNSTPWMQVGCGDIRNDNGINNPMPAGQTMITINPSCLDPGIVFTGQTTAVFGQGQASSTNQVVGGNASSYPEVYSPSDNGGIFTSYSSLLSKSKNSDTPPTDLATICTLSNCTLPATLPHGIYIAHSSVNIINASYTFPSNQNYVFLIDGTLTFSGNIITPAGTDSSVIFSSSGSIIIPPTVGSSVGTKTANLSGIFSTDKSFIMQSNNTCTDLRLNIEGALVVNAGLAGGSLQNNRDLCGNNAIAPTLQITQRLDYVLNMPDFVKEQTITSQEIAP